LLVMATVGYSFMSSDVEDVDSANEMGIDFVRQNGLWMTVLDGETFAFQYLPSEVSNVSVNGAYDLSGYVDEILYFVDAGQGAGEVLNNIDRYILKSQGACLKGRECTEDLPTKNCSYNLMIYDAGNVSMVYRNESCVYIVGDAVRGTDAFLYEVLGIN
jgi:hypothetical protein